MDCRQEDANFANKVAQLCCEHFKTLNKRGKPQADHEWTLLAAIVLVQEQGQLLAFKTVLNEISRARGVRGGGRESHLYMYFFSFPHDQFDNFLTLACYVR